MFRDSASDAVCAFLQISFCWIMEDQGFGEPEHMLVINFLFDNVIENMFVNAHKEIMDIELQIVCSLLIILCY